MITEIQKTNNGRVKKAIEMLFLTTKKESLDQEEIIKECEKNDLTEDEVKESLKILCSEKFVKDLGHFVYVLMNTE